MADALQNPLLTRIDEIGRLHEPPLTREAICLRAGLSRDVLRQLEARGPRASLNASTLAKIAEALNVSVDVFAPRPGAARGGARRLPPIETQDVPIRGVVAGSAIGAFVLQDSPIDYAPRPPALATVPDAYAVYVENDSMAPLHARGDLRFVHPHRPPRPGDSVVIQTEERRGERQGWIKIFERQTAEWVVCRQLNPAAEVKFKASQVVSTHRVLTTNELFNK